MVQKIVGIYLAAGKSSRFGTNKLRADVYGQPLGRIAFYTAMQSELTDIVIVTNDQELFMDDLQNGYRQRLYVVKGNKEAGQASSLKKGLIFAEQLGAAAIVVLLADQPLITVDSINQLIHTYETDKQYYFVGYKVNGIIAPPLLCGWRFYSSIHQLKGDIGARFLIQKALDKGIILDGGHAHLFFDVDTEEDYERLLEMEIFKSPHGKS